MERETSSTGRELDENAEWQLEQAAQDDFPDQLVQPEELEPQDNPVDEPAGTANLETQFMGGVKVQILTARAFLNHALVHNQIPLVTEIGVRNDGETRANAELHLEVLVDGIVFGHAISKKFDLDNGLAMKVSGSKLPLRLSPRRMLSVGWNEPAEIRARVIWNGKIIAEDVIETTVLSSRQWVMATSLVNGERRMQIFDPLSMEMLAAFVQPQHPAIKDLIAESFTKLMAWGQSGFSGYQVGDPHLIDAQVRAIVEAMRSKGVVYHNPEPGWIQGAGQMIRTPQEVLVDREGTCLDTTVVLAAALERIGVNPVIVVIEGHAFLGYWRIDSVFEQGYLAERGSIQDALNSGLLGFIETTMCTAGNEAASYQEIVEHPLKFRLKPDLSNLIGVIDVVASRRLSRINPVPAVVSENGKETIVIYEGSGREEARERVIKVENDQAIERNDRKPAPPRVAYWKNALLDLSLRNALINYRGQGAQLLVGSQISQFEDIINAGQTVTLLPADQLPEVAKAQGAKTAADLPIEVISELVFSQGKVFTDAQSGRYETLLSRLQYRARTYRQETGANNLFLAIGMLSWNFKGQPLKSPLVLVPVRIERVAKSAEFRITLDDTGESTPNFSLLEKLRRELGIELPEMWAPIQDQSGIDIKETFRKLQGSLIEAGVSGFHVTEEVHLAILQFSKFRLWKDLDEHWEEFTNNPVVNHLALQAHEVFDDPVKEPNYEDLDELLLGCPLPADGSQLRAISHAIAGRSFVLEGPPGTGKSQTITNMLARAMVEGKKVLFVAEKAQALSVVKNRLDSVGLGALTLDVHEKSSSPAQIKAQILAALDASVSFEAGKVEDTRRTLDASHQLLTQYAEKASRKNAAGLSLYEALNDALEPREGIPPLSIPDELVATSSEERLASLREATRNIIDLEGSVVTGTRSGWRFLGIAIDGEKLVELISHIETLDKLATEISNSTRLGKTLTSAQTPRDFATMLEVYGRYDLTVDKLRAVQTVQWEKSVELILSHAHELAESPDPALLVFKPEILDLDLNELFKTHASLGNAGFFEKSRLKKSLVAILASQARPRQKIKNGRIDLYMQYLSELKSKTESIRRQALDTCSISISGEWNPLSEAGRAEFEAEADRLRRLSSDLVGEDSDPEMIRAVERLRDAATPEEVRLVQDFQTALSDLQSTFALDGSDFDNWDTQRMGLVQKWIATMPDRGTTSESRITSLGAWNRLLQALQPFREASLHIACDEILNGVVRLSDVPLSFENGIAAASVKERAATLGLERFDGPNHDVQVNRYSRSLAMLRELMPASMAHRVLVSRPFDTTSTRGRIAQLRNQVTKKKGGLTTRALFTEFSDIIPNLLPCVMTNPDSLARLFPPRSKQFDIVIFDEASQIRVAEAIGAMGRANSVVVVGDTRQMPPSSFARVSDDAGNLEEVESLADQEQQVGDQESLLDECKQALNNPLELTWHYRSQDESLIAFSNDAYYENKLSSFPTPKGKKHESGFGIKFHYVENSGLPANFLKSMQNSKGDVPKSPRINLNEAYEITQEVIKRFDASPDKVPSIGIVTFNIEQRTVIENALNRSGHSRVAAALQDDSEEGLFVKNIEFVQGDERDAILFSIGRTPGENGFVSLTGFGPLTQQGGHRRFNVAITRARQEVHLFCSFLPHQLQAETATNEGVKNLKAYLEWAYGEPGKVEGEFGTGPYKKEIKDAHRDDIAKALEENGFEVSRDLGLSDFRVDLSIRSKNIEGSPEIAILLDGPPWRARSTTFDRDVLPVDILKNLMGWPHVIRIWTPEWLRDKESVVARVIDVATRLAQGGVPTQDEDSIRQLDELEPDDSRGTRDLGNPRGAAESFRTAPPNVGGSLSNWSPYEPVVAASRDYLDYLPHNRQAVEGVQKIMRFIVEREGPISFSRLCRLTAATFDLTKLSANRVATIQAVIPRDLQKTRDERFAWPAELDPDSWEEFRPSEDLSIRPLDVISKREIANAMSHHARMALGMHKDDLFRETLGTFGGKRITPTIQVALEGALKHGLDSGKLTVDSDGVYRGVVRN